MKKRILSVITSIVMCLTFLMPMYPVKIANAYSSIAITVDSSGRPFAWPVPSCNVISSCYNCRGYSHGALDIAAGYGEKIYASAAGYVYEVKGGCSHNYGKSVSCGCNGDAGNRVVIKHTINDRVYWTIYMHMTDIYVSQGQSVNTNTVIGTVGSTGWSSGPHLDFSIRSGDPNPWYSAKYDLSDLCQNPPASNFSLTNDCESCCASYIGRMATYCGWPPLKVVPSKPTISISAGTTTKGTTFSWNACTNTEEYHLYIYPQGSDDWLISTAVSGTSKTINLPEGKYSASVASVNNSYGTHQFSDRVNFNVSLGDCVPTAVTTYNGHVYALYENWSYYDQAKNLCSKMGGHLATITSEGENKAVTELVKNSSVPGYWLGGNDIASEGAWVWETGESFSYSNWESGEPNNDSGIEDYLMIYPSGKWNDSRVDINHAFGFVLEIEPMNPTKTGENNGKLYYRFDKYLNKTEANAYAQAIGGKLVDTSNESTKTFVKELIGDKSLDAYWTSSSSGSPNYNTSKSGFICELPKNVSSIEIKSKPDKLEYYLDDTLDTTGLSITVKYDKGEDSVITSDFIATADMSTLGEKKVTVTYQGKTASFPITVLCPKPEINFESKNDTTVELSWRKISVASEYTVMLNGKKYTSVKDNRCKITGLSPATQYDIQIIAVSGSDVLEKSETATIKTSNRVTFAGKGTEDDPYQISCSDDIVLMSELINDELSNVHFRSAYYIQTRNIDIANVQFTPIGSCDTSSRAYFSGNYNGNYHSINNLNVVTEETEYAGLFGKIDNSLGECSYCSVSNLSVFGEYDSSSKNTGGIAGMISGGASIYGCSFTGHILGYMNIGGIAGTISDGGIVDTCYHNGVIEGMNCGGIVGSVTQSQENKKFDAYIVGCYHHNGKIDSWDHGGGIVGIESSSVNYYNNFYEKGNSSGGVDGKTNDNAKPANTTVLNALAETLGIPYANNDDKSLNNGCPVFVWQLPLHKFSGEGTDTSPYLISSKSDLMILNEYLNDASIGYMFRGASYLQTADIDLSGTAWKPLASENNAYFTGKYDGGCHKITNMNVTDSSCGGFFGRVSGGKVVNLSVEKSVIKLSSGDAGGITAQLTDGAIIQNCAYIGDVSAKNAGGIAGTVMGGTIISSYQNGKVTGSESAGGIAGTVSEQGAKIENCYHGAGNVSATAKGGIIGKSGKNEEIDNTYYLKDSVSGTVTSGGSAINQTILSNLAETLGSPFSENSSKTYNNGSPVFIWQNVDAVSATITGDVNCDGSISIADAVLLQKYLLAAYSLNKQQWLNADMDHDGCVDIFDMVFMRRELIKRMGVE